MLAQELKKARLAVGLTQEQLAAKSSVSREYINYLEKAKRQPTMEVFIRICKALKVYPPEMLERIVGPEKSRKPAK